MIPTSFPPLHAHAAVTCNRSNRLLQSYKASSPSTSALFFSKLHFVNPSAMDSSSTDHNNEEDDNNNSNINHHLHVFSPQPPQPFWNFISLPPPPPPSPSKRMSHAGTANNPSALNLTLTHRPCNMPSGRGGSSSKGNCYHSKSNQRRRTDHLMAAAAASSSQPSPPCTECGRRFPSPKALFGHMRCHPERTWRGINPPSDVRRTAASTSVTADGEEITKDELVVAEALLFLAAGVFLKRQKKSRRRSSAQTTPARGRTQEEPAPAGGPGRNNIRGLGVSHGQAPGTSTSGHGDGNALSTGTSSGQQAPAGHSWGNLQGGGGGGGQNSSLFSSMMYVPDLNLPPPPENSESSNVS